MADLCEETLASFRRTWPLAKFAHEIKEEHIDMLYTHHLPAVFFVLGDAQITGRIRIGVAVVSEPDLTRRARGHKDRVLVVAVAAADLIGVAVARRTALSFGMRLEAAVHLAVALALVAVADEGVARAAGLREAVGQAGGGGHPVVRQGRPRNEVGGTDVFEAADADRQVHDDLHRRDEVVGIWPGCRAAEDRRLAEEVSDVRQEQRDEELGVAEVCKVAGDAGRSDCERGGLTVLRGPHEGHGHGGGPEGGHVGRVHARGHRDRSGSHLVRPPWAALEFPQEAETRNEWDSEPIIQQTNGGAYSPVPAQDCRRLLPVAVEAVQSLIDAVADGGRRLLGRVQDVLLFAGALQHVGVLGGILLVRYPRPPVPVLELDERVSPALTVVAVGGEDVAGGGGEAVPGAGLQLQVGDDGAEGQPSQVRLGEGRLLGVLEARLVGGSVVLRDSAVDDAVPSDEEEEEERVKSDEGPRRATEQEPRQRVSRRLPVGPYCHLPLTAARNVGRSIFRAKCS